MRIAVCDDQHHERQTIIGYLQEEKVFQLDIKEFSSADKFVQAVKAGQQYDLVYLDIEMPGKYNGMTAAHWLAELGLSMMLVFITGYREYVNEGYKVSAMDFLVKPVDPQEFHQTFRRCQKKYEAQKYLVFETRDDTLQIMVSDMLMIVARKNYVDIIYRGHKVPFEYRTTMNTMQQKLAEYGFYRCHPSYLINLAYIKRLYSDQNEKGYWAEIFDGQQRYKVEVSQNKWSEIKTMLHKYRRGAF